MITRQPTQTMDGSDEELSLIPLSSGVDAEEDIGGNVNSVFSSSVSTTSSNNEGGTLSSSLERSAQNVESLMLQELSFMSGETITDPQPEVSQARAASISDDEGEALGRLQKDLEHADSNHEMQAKLLLQGVWNSDHTRSDRRGSVDSFLSDEAWSADGDNKSVSTSVSNAQYSVNSAEEVDKLAYILEQSERNEDDRMLDLEVQARRAEALGDDEEVARIRESIAARNRAREARRSALDVLQRAMSSPVQRAARKKVSAESADQPSQMIFDLSEKTNSPAGNIVTRLLARGGWNQSESSDNSTATPFLGDVEDPGATRAPLAVLVPPPPPLSDPPSNDQENISAVLNRETASSTAENTRTVLGLLAFAMDASSDHDFPMQRTGSESSPIQMYRSQEETDSEALCPSEREFKDSPSSDGGSQTRGFIDEGDLFVNNPKESGGNEPRDSARNTRRRRRRMALLSILILVAIVVIVVLVTGNEELDRVIIGTGLVPTPAPGETKAPTIAVDSLGRPLLSGDRSHQISTLLNFVLDHSSPQGFYSIPEEIPPVFPSSPLHFKSIEWLANDDPAQIEINWESADRLVDRFVLSAFFLSRSNQESLNQATVSAKAWMSEFDVCFWSGVSCTESDDINAFRVQQLDLTGSLGGTIPSELGWLTLMRDLSLSVTAMTGSMPAELGELTRLSRLVLHYNQFVGTIPEQFSLLTNLKQMHLDNNQLTGSIPIDFMDLKQLTDLNLGVNQLTGEIPEPLVDLGRDAVVLGSNKFDSCNDAWYQC